ncbi:class II fructose-bisphosphate aldolase [Heyndrickxia sp. FSL W8-0423]|uniref:class II fructose-bisphosphate aldolase n=1 Tax=Heyndrickxia sp. FSL W8-0423 TaxID=2921601 RepID=UPI0030F8BF4A
MLVTLKELLADAKEKKYAVGSFNTPNLETARAVIAAAEELNVPVIIAHAEVHNDLISLDVMGPIMVQLAKQAKVPVCVHLDHGSSFDACVKAMHLGFTSVMYDASAKSFEENVNETKEIVKIAHSLGVSVEAELGHIFTSSIGGGEGRGPLGAEDFNSLDDAYTNPDLAKEFVERTQVDALAIAFGTTHGVYLTKPELDLNRITEVKNKIDIPFVMHGGSGLSEAEFKEAINNGITKINYFTYMTMAGGKSVVDFVQDMKEKNETVFFHDIALVAEAGIKENVKEALRVFTNR